uniref:Uncharacterized protein n=1 Tax=Acrobeloides nanus TaxID=290746 RepID=A0A914D9I2_9BILA
MSNLNIPMPFGMSPLKMNSLSSGGAEASDGNSSPEKTNELRRSPTTNNRTNSNILLDRRSRIAFEKARQLCLQENNEACDQALENYHAIRFGYKSKHVQRFQDSPDDLPSYVQTGLAKWVVPGLETSLEKMLSPEISFEYKKSKINDQAASENDHKRKRIMERNDSKIARSPLSLIVRKPVERIHLVLPPR